MMARSTKRGDESTRDIWTARSRFSSRTSMTGPILRSSDRRSLNPILSMTSDHYSRSRGESRFVQNRTYSEAQPRRTKNTPRDPHQAMESSQPSPSKMKLDEMFSSPNSVEYVPNFLLRVLWMTAKKPRFSSSDMNKIAQLVRQLYGEKSTEDLVDISAVKWATIEDVQKNSRILVPDSKLRANETEWVFCGQASSAAAAGPREVGHPWNAWRLANEWSGEGIVNCDHFSFCRDKPQDFRLYGLGGRVHLELLLKLECTRSERQTKATLSLQHMDFGMETNCLDCKSTHESRSDSCKWNCGKFFVHSVQITVSPDAWAQDCGELKPSATPTVFGRQSSSSYAVQLNPFNLKNSAYTLQTSTVVSYSAPAFKWDPARRRSFRTNAVDWTWNLDRLADGTKFNYNTWLGCNVDLGLNPAHTQINCDSVSASWGGHRNVDLQQLQKNWHMTIIVKTAFDRRKTRSPLGWKLKEGPTIAFSQDGLTFV